MAVKHQTVELEIQGMTCASCVGRVTKALEALPGVKEARVQLVNHSARVLYDSSLLQVDQIYESLKSAGYHGELRTSPSKLQSSRLSAEDFRALGSLLLSLPLLTPMLLMPFGVHWMPSIPLQFGLAVLVVFGFGFPLLQGASRALVALRGNMDLLVSLGALSALGLSLFEWLSGRPEFVYFESAAAIVSFVLVGKSLEAQALKRTQLDLARLETSLPSHAERILAPGETEKVEVSLIQVGDYLQISPFESIPVDGVIEYGTSEITEAFLTGEPLPVRRTLGDQVLSGSWNGDSPIVIRATAKTSESFLGHLMSQVRDAQSSKAPIQREVDRLSMVLVPLVLTVALLTAVGTYSFLGLSEALLRMVAVLVVACPCALGLATPTAIFVSVGAGASRGILFRSAEAVESLSKLTLLGFDKTGTLTWGEPEWSLSVVHESRMDLEEFRKRVQSLQFQLTHPLARACCVGLTRSPLIFENRRLLPGSGVEGTYQGKHYELKRAESHHFTSQNLKDFQGSLSVLLEDGELLGYVGFSDRLKHDAAPVLKNLSQEGIKLHLITGDRKEAALALVSELERESILTLHASQTPQTKAQLLQEFRSQGEYVGYFGDGVNDSLALTQAQVGIAVGSGSELALQSAGVSFLVPRTSSRNAPTEWSLLPGALRLSRITVRTIRQNLIWAFLYNSLAIPLAASGQLTPTVAAAAMTLSSLTVVGNSLRIRRQWYAVTRSHFNA